MCRSFLFPSAFRFFAILHLRDRAARLPVPHAVLKRFYGKGYERRVQDHPLTKIALSVHTFIISWRICACKLPLPFGCGYSVSVSDDVPLPGGGAKPAIGLPDDDRRHERRQYICRGHGIEHPVQPEEVRQEQCQPDTEDDFTDHGEHGRFHGVAHCLQKDEGGFIDAGEDHHAEVDTERPDRKVRIIHAFVFCPENADEHLREQLDDHQRHSAEDGFRDQERGKQFSDPPGLLRPHIVPDDRDTACRHADDDGDHDLKELHHDADDRHRDLRVLLLSEDGVLRSVFAEHIVDRRHGSHQRDLCEKAA